MKTAELLIRGIILASSQAVFGNPQHGFSQVAAKERSVTLNRRNKFRADVFARRRQMPFAYRDRLAEPVRNVARSDPGTREDRSGNFRIDACCKSIVVTIGGRLGS